jgi:lysophospholipase L1-like esterase
LFENPNVLSRGIDGNTTADVLNRMDAIVRHKPSKVFLEIGTRDLDNGITVADIVDNISKITKSFPDAKSDARIYIFSVLPSAPVITGATPECGQPQMAIL